ncbi:MAG TPA: noncanonical pyrimidine nucleotidase, YjjG family [Cytophagales bacterium]|nr:noncanonical pyrimidine nucleotidase, YjjG family [Cytophagales bacterium]HAA24405.1 noncanonical pyrimidine nucleotidase, YjjG family [Cytophagales bacterium]HAP59691.1 noncanonical pyrimidine nucleotidase, YjjG family [Cytophagales bacterium]
MAYQHLFFDLDHTLWDFDRNSTETLRELYSEFDFEGRYQFSEDRFLNTFLEVNHALWMDYNHGRIDRNHIRTRRFDLVLDALDASATDRPADLGEVYLARCPLKPHTLPHTHDVLDYLQAKGYALHIITNGFSDVQDKKLKAAGLDHYFDVVVTSETNGHKKPSPEIFYFALQSAKADLDNSLMIGDNLETDIAGAQAIAMDQVFFNPRKHYHPHRPTFEISSLDEMKTFL